MEVSWFCGMGAGKGNWMRGKREVGSGRLKGEVESGKGCKWIGMSMSMIHSYV